MQSGVTNEEIEVDLRLSVIKPSHATWLVSLYNHLTSIASVANGKMQLPPEDPFEDSISVMQFCRLSGRLLFFALCTFTEHHKLRFKQRTV